MSAQTSRRCILLYRGSLERSRLAFILEVALQHYKDIDFVWLFPGKLTPHVESVFTDFIAGFKVSSCHVLNHRLSSYLKSRRELSSIGRRVPDYDLVLVGSSASVYTGSFTPRRVIWFINGIPEEAAMNSRAKGMMSSFQWGVYKLFVKPSLIVTVSNRMSGYVRRHFPGVRIEAAPTCVDTSTFRPPNGWQRQPGIFVYLGTGAAWQALDVLSELWQAIHKLDNTIKFRVVSRDPRTKVLAVGIDSSAIEFVQSNNFKEVATFLHNAEVGFLIRKDNIVNCVSFPTKLGEYLAAGCWVVATDLDWDVSDYISETPLAGMKLTPDLPVNKMAQSILDYRKKIDRPRQREAIELAVGKLDRGFWIKKLTSTLETEL